MKKIKITNKNKMSRHLKIINVILFSVVLLGIILGSTALLYIPKFASNDYGYWTSNNQIDVQVSTMGWCGFVFLTLTLMSIVLLFIFNKHYLKQNKLFITSLISSLLFVIFILISVGLHILLLVMINLYSFCLNPNLVKKILNEYSKQHA